MNILTYFVLISAGFLLSSAKKSNESSEESGLSHQDSINCMMDYITNNCSIIASDKHFYTRLFGKNLTHSFDKEKCKALIDGHAKELYETVKKDVKDDKELTKITDCVIANLKKRNFEMFTIKLMLINQTRSRRQLSNRKKKKILRNIEYSMEKAIDVATSLCTFEDMQSAAFDELATLSRSGNSSQQSLTLDYCVRKHLVDNGFIDTNVYKIELNPEHVNTTGVNCFKIVLGTKNIYDELLLTNFETNFERITNKRIKCIEKKINDHNYFENSFRIVIMAENSAFTDEQKQAEKKSFIGKMKLLSADVYTC